MVVTVDVERPLVALLGQVLTAFTLEHEEKARASLPLGANVLRVMGSELVRIRDLPALTGISKEGIAMATGYLQRHRLSTAQRSEPSVSRPRDSRRGTTIDIERQRRRTTGCILRSTPSWRSTAPCPQV